MRALMQCAINDGQTLQKSQIARACNASENHLAQVIQALAHAGFIITTRGRGGGLRLAQPATEISVGQVFRTFEASLPFAECYDPQKNTCPLTGFCRLRLAFDKAVAAFYHELDAITLDELVAGNLPLEELLNIADRAAPGCNAVA